MGLQIVLAHQFGTYLEAHQFLVVNAFYLAFFGEIAKVLLVSDGDPSQDSHNLSDFYKVDLVFVLLDIQHLLSQPKVLESDPLDLGQPLACDHQVIAMIPALQQPGNETPEHLLNLVADSLVSHDHIE